MLDELLLQQHVAIAVTRFDNEQRKLRFSYDEVGWDKLPGVSDSIPRLHLSRILALLKLMADFELLADAGSVIIFFRIKASALCGALRVQ